MQDVKANTNQRQLKYRGRAAQVPIYLGKMVRMFVYRNDWVSIPMAALIAGMVAMVIRSSFGISMEGTLKGAFALTCVALWNGCFNSIQVICHERNIIKREHRSGMHMSSYVAAHMIYQFAICLAQTALTMYVCRVVGVSFAGKGVVTEWMYLDIFISMLIIAYTADMMALLISAIVHTTTAAMTVMPFILIFQLVFSGGIFTLPNWANGISDYTISHYGMSVIAAQAHYNELPMSSGWSTLEMMKDTPIAEGITIGDAIDYAGDDIVRETVMKKTAEANQNEEYDSTSINIVARWLVLLFFGLIYVTITIILLEFIDRDKR